MSSDATVVPVVAACIMRGEEVLLSERLVAREPSTLGKREFPGGVVRFGECLEDAVRREVLEELNLRVEPIKLLHAQINTYESEVNYLVMFYRCILIGSLPKSTDSLCWVHPKDVIKGEWDVLPGTKEAARKLLRR